MKLHTFVDGFARDLRHAARGIRRNPGFAVALVLTLGLGVGANAAMFSVVDALVLRPLSYGQPEKLVEARAVSPESGRARRFVPLDVARAWERHAGFFEDLLLHVRGSALYTGGAEPRMLTVEGVTPRFEETLGVRPELGRGFVQEDAEPGAEPVTVLSHAFFRTAFGGDTTAIGRRIELDDVRHRIVGVMPPGFKFPTYATTELWVSLRRNGATLSRDVGSVDVLGRIGSGQELEAARERARALGGAVAEALPDGDEWGMDLVPLEEHRLPNEDRQRALWLLGGAVVLILLIAGVNGTSLLLVRGWSRARELAVRTALGASRRRLVAHLLTESVLLALAAGAVAVLLALLTLSAIHGIMPRDLTFFAPHAIEVEPRTLAFTFALAGAAGLLVGLVPALRAVRVGTAAAEAGLTAYAARTPRKRRLRRTLVVAEVALSVMLLIGAGLLTHSFVRLVRVDPGFRVEELAVLQLSLSDERYPSGDVRGEFLRSLERRIERLPRVEGVAVGAGSPPGGGLHLGVQLETDGAAPPAEGQPDIVPSAQAAADFLEVLEVPLAAGRAFTAEDMGTDRVIVDRDLARFLWGNENPVGRRFRISPEADWLTVVGVTRDLKLTGPDDRHGDFAVLYPTSPEAVYSYVPLAIRTRGDPQPLLSTIREIVHTLDPDQPIQELRPATDAYMEEIDMPRFLMVLMAALSGLALALAAIGIHGVLAFGVAQRRHELGVRMAVGARPAALSRRVVAEGLALAATGAALGTVGALAFSRLLRGLLYDVEPTDPATVAVVLAVGLAASAIACYRPARHAAQVDPVQVLRAE